MSTHQSKHSEFCSVFAKLPVWTSLLHFEFTKGESSLGPNSLKPGAFQACVVMCRDYLLMLLMKAGRNNNFFLFFVLFIQHINVFMIIKEIVLFWYFLVLKFVFPCHCTIMPI